MSRQLSLLIFLFFLYKSICLFKILGIVEIFKTDIYLGPTTQAMHNLSS